MAHLRRDELRVGDEVYFYDAGEYFEGSVEKVNGRSVKVRQTNDNYRFTRRAFGNRGGRRKGGLGRLWTCGVDSSGVTRLTHTRAQRAALKDTSRGMVMEREARLERLERVAYWTESFLAVGGDVGELRARVESTIEALEATSRTGE